MSSWHEHEEREAAASERPDLARWIWIGVAVLIALMLGAMFLLRKPPANFSQAQVRHILIPVKGQDPAERQRALDLAQTVRTRILDGESFEDLARQYSGDPASASRGGYLGWSKRGTYAPNFEAYVWAGDIGAISDIISTEFGFHIIEVIDRQLSDADKYDIEIDRKAWEQQRQEEATRAKSGGAPAAAPIVPHAEAGAAESAPPVPAPASPAPAAPAPAATP